MTETTQRRLEAIIDRQAVEMEAIEQTTYNVCSADVEHLICDVPETMPKREDFQTDLEFVLSYRLYCLNLIVKAWKE